MQKTSFYFHFGLRSSKKEHQLPVPAKFALVVRPAEEYDKNNPMPFVVEILNIKEDGETIVTKENYAHLYRNIVALMKSPKFLEAHISPFVTESLEGAKLSENVIMNGDALKFTCTTAKIAAIWTKCLQIMIVYYVGNSVQIDAEDRVLKAKTLGEELIALGGVFKNRAEIVLNALDQEDELPF
jgi:hypothetical protein